MMKQFIFNDDRHMAIAFWNYGKQVYAKQQGSRVLPSLHADVLEAPNGSRRFGCVNNNTETLSRGLVRIYRIRVTPKKGFISESEYHRFLKKTPSTRMWKMATEKVDAR